MKVDLSCDEIAVLLVVLGEELKLGNSAVAANDIAGCFNAMPPRLLNPLIAKLCAARAKTEDRMK